ncbi:MAG: DUF1461 domain-containing protein [Ketobacter sp.]|nr:MAG: DUF1461 domain-containing protein [Ketobacter sp.]
MPSTPSNRVPLFIRISSGTMLTVSLLIVSLWSAWQLAAWADFGYTSGYRLLNIEQHIQTYGPQNRYKPDFQLTAPSQHKRLFSDIADAVQHGGRGLESISYQTIKDETHTLLRKPEVVHLQDVANLISLCNRIAIFSIMVLIIMLLYYRKQGLSPPKPTQIALGSIIVLCLMGLALFIIGPTQTFYWLHTKIFPDNHQWFFYYQDSLMTTLMKAPDLFGFIAGVWAVIAILVFALFQYAAYKIIR